MGTRNAQAAAAFAAPPPINHLPVKELPEFFLSPSTSIHHLSNLICIPTNHLGNPIRIPTNKVTKMIIKIYEGHGIRIARQLRWTEVGLKTETGVLLERRSISISKGGALIIEVVEVSVKPNSAARLSFKREVILGGKWVVDQPVDLLPMSTTTTAPPPPYSSLPTDTTIAGLPVIESSDIAVTVRDTDFGRGAISQPCKQITVAFGLTPTCNLTVDLFMAKVITPIQPVDSLQPVWHVLDPNISPPLATVLGPWSVYQRHWISPVPPTPPLLTPPIQSTTPSIFRRMSTMIKTLGKAGTSRNLVQHLPAA
jgi:hypothetical protein